MEIFTIASPSLASITQLEDRVSKGFRSIEVKTSETLLREFEPKLRNLRLYGDRLEYASVHAPSSCRGRWVDLASDDKEALELSLACVRKSMELASEIGCRRLVFHSYSSFPEIDDASTVLRERSEALGRLKRSVDALEDDCREYEIRLCLENINARLEIGGQRWFNILSVLPSEMPGIVEEIGSDHLRFAFDTAHALNACNLHRQNPLFRRLFKGANTELDAFLERVSDWIEVVQISDAKGSLARRGTEGLPLGQGEIDFVELFKVIVRKGLAVPLILEINEADVNDAVETARSRDLVLSMLRTLGWRL